MDKCKNCDNRFFECYNTCNNYDKYSPCKSIRTKKKILKISRKKKK